VKSSAVSSYKRAGNLSGIKVTCNSKPYLVVAGKLVRVSEETFSHYPTGNRTLEPGTCTTLKISGAAGSRFIITSDKKYFLVEDGKKRPIANRTQYIALKGSGPKAFTVDARFASRIPTGSKVPNSASAVEDNVAAPTPSPTATPSPTQSPTPTPSPSATSGRTYTVKAGDTLSGIASRFGTTTAILMDLNDITNANQIQVGQVLKLP
jgi:LysM repeat protein